LAPLGAYLSTLYLNGSSLKGGFLRVSYFFRVFVIDESSKLPLHPELDGLLCQLHQSLRDAVDTAGFLLFDLENRQRSVL
jgi:hypothetical protein